MPKKNFIKCHDCGKRYEIGAPHYMVCEARTCAICEITYNHLIPKNASGVRICDACHE